MKLGIVGLSSSGKTTLFNALTRGNLPVGVGGGGFQVNTAVVSVPDPRVDQLIAMYNPRKITRTQVTYADIGGLDKGINEGGMKGQFKNELAQFNGIVHVVRAFQDDSVLHPNDTIDPQRDVDTLDGEFLLTDLVTLENRIARVQEDLKRKGKAGDSNLEDELKLLERLKATLENDQPLRVLDDLHDDQLKTLRGFGLLTLKPMLIVVNLGEKDRDVDVTKLVNVRHAKTRVVGLQAKIEAELSQLSGDDVQMFMDEYGITELSASKVIRLSYELMAIQSFFTVGADEVRAWPVRIGATAPEAAGVIHNDLQKGFIRAEVMAYTDLVTAGSEAALKSIGKFRLEGKEYIVKDGDIVHIRHSG
jgi:ribosome-binding ATPase